jgi:hypothetical protein
MIEGRVNVGIRCAKGSTEDEGEHGKCAVGHS